VKNPENQGLIAKPQGQPHLLLPQAFAGTLR
jgi:hypothetical protein